MEKSKNGLGVAGFVLALVGLVLCWVPVVNLILGGLAFIFSLIGLITGISKKKKLGLSIAGLCICLIPLVYGIYYLAVGSAIIGGANELMNMF